MTGHGGRDIYFHTTPCSWHSCICLGPLVNAPWWNALTLFLDNTNGLIIEPTVFSSIPILHLKLVSYREHINFSCYLSAKSWSGWNLQNKIVPWSLHNGVFSIGIVKHSDAFTNGGSQIVRDKYKNTFDSGLEGRSPFTALWRKHIFHVYMHLYTMQTHGSLLPDQDSCGLAYCRACHQGPALHLKMPISTKKVQHRKCR